MQPVEHDVAAEVEERVDGGGEQRERRGGHRCVDCARARACARSAGAGAGAEGGGRTLERAEHKVADEARVDGDLDLGGRVCDQECGRGGVRGSVRAVWRWLPPPWPLRCALRWVSAGR